MHEEKSLKILFLPGLYPSEKNIIYGIFVKEHAIAASLYADVVVLYSERGDKKCKHLWEVISDYREEDISYGCKQS